MLLLTRTLTAFFLILAQAAPTWAREGLTIASGAGYKRLVHDLSAAFTAQTGYPVQQVFGNMGQIIPQAQESGAFDFLLGDERHLGKADLHFSGDYSIGKGKLVAAVAKGCTLDTLSELTNDTITRVAMPDPHKAIYGFAANEYLNNAGLWQPLQTKLLIVGTVPQVSTYLLSGEVDVGFINLTEAMAMASKVGKLIPVDESLYSPIIILAKRLAASPHTEASEAFIAFLQSPEARKLAQKHGL
ncbi:molybdate ABC transporter substrate-binding protein [Desulfobulbus rhabdoformis]|uniref:molybdate ABC transporter substrate-binding protein n=1 Tax=Desulfobulbus rhabdoformis TaxID=34032 RepID=UPI001964D68E|nr:molybdate ABC transporter substrate-binding protein [Desulfobulbus rhabdoformis]MBM9615538.1 molybdate ABC transporter substrate-binding protein [Desulfobulbus rhabdoformis]